MVAVPAGNKKGGAIMHRKCKGETNRKTNRETNRENNRENNKENNKG
jgi:hypothetical protein